MCLSNLKNEAFESILTFVFVVILTSCDSESFDRTLYQNAMGRGKEVLASTPEPEKYFDDLIHPCIRYIPDGFAGHKWWMIATPYRDSNSKIENPILYYGDSGKGDVPPLTWTAVGIVEGTPATGYNSDPCILHDGSRLWVFWRENYSPDCKKNSISRGTFGKYTTNGIKFGEKRLYAPEKRDTIDSEMCPIVVNFEGRIRLYASNYEFKPHRRSLGLSVWDIKNNDLFKNQFTKTMDVVPIYKPNFDFWHFDMFEYKGKYYCVTTPEKADQILLGESKDGLNFTFWDKPLLSTPVSGTEYMYKASAMVHNGIFYLWYPVAVSKNPRSTRIHMSEIDFDELIRRLNQH